MTPFCKKHSGRGPQPECKDCQEIIADLRSRPFPLARDSGHIPWALAEEAYLVYITKGGRGQSLERVAQRGGFYPEEMDDFLPNWRPVNQTITNLKDRLRQAKQLLALVPNNVHEHDCGMNVGDKIDSCTCHCKPIREFLAQQ